MNDDFEARLMNAALYGKTPTLEDLRDTACTLNGLIEALDDLSDRLGPDGEPLAAIIVSARPFAARLARGLDRITTLAEAETVLAEADSHD